MEPFDDTSVLAQILPGRWVIQATNIPRWLSEGRRDVVFEYRLLREHPLSLRHEVSFTEPDGARRTRIGRDRWNGTGFTWRPSGLRGLTRRGRWEVAAIRQGLVVLRFLETLSTPHGIDVVVEEGVDPGELRAVFAADPSAFGLEVEEFASLTWFTPVPERPADPAGPDTQAPESPEVPGTDPAP